MTLTTHSTPLNVAKDWKLTPTRRPTITVGCSASPLPSTMNRTECKYDRIATNENRVKCFIIITGVIQKKNLAVHLKTTFLIKFFPPFQFDNFSLCYCWYYWLQNLSSFSLNNFTVTVHST